VDSDLCVHWNRHAAVFASRPQSRHQSGNAADTPAGEGMSTDSQHGAAPVVAPNKLTQVTSNRHLDALDQPARPLGKKRQALQQRRAQSAVRAAGQPSAGTSVMFELRTTSTGLLVERTQSRAVGARLVQTLLFTDLREFERWCASEPTRFDDPIRFSQLRRDGHEALRSGR
jgi:hypothetical protein